MLHLFRGFFTANEISHILTKDSKSLYSLMILYKFFRIAEAMNLVPIPRGNNGHIHDREVLVKPVKCGRGAAAPADNNCSARFSGDFSVAAVKQSVQKRAQGAGWSCIIHRGSYDHAIKILQSPFEMIDPVIDDTSS